MMIVSEPVTGLTGVFLPRRVQGQLHGPDAQRPHVRQRTIDAFFAVGLGGLEGHAQSLPHRPVTTFGCPHSLLQHPLRKDENSTFYSVFWGKIYITESKTMNIL